METINKLSDAQWATILAALRHRGQECLDAHLKQDTNELLTLANDIEGGRYRVLVEGSIRTTNDLAKDIMAAMDRVDKDTGAGHYNILWGAISDALRDNGIDVDAKRG